MLEQVQSLLSQAKKQIEECQDLKVLNDIRVEYLGKQGKITNLLHSMKDIDKEERPKAAIKRMSQIEKFNARYGKK